MSSVSRRKGRGLALEAPRKRVNHLCVGLGGRRPAQQGDTTILHDPCQDL
jgi:hypothetical protein